MLIVEIAVTCFEDVVASSREKVVVLSIDASIFSEVKAVVPLPTQ